MCIYVYVKEMKKKGVIVEMIPIARRTMRRKGREKIEGEDSIVHDEREKA